MNLSTEPHKRRDGIHVPDDFAAQLAERGTFNALISNGQWLFVTATSRLHWLTRRCRWISRRSPHLTMW